MMTDSPVPGIDDVNSPALGMNDVDSPVPGVDEDVDDGVVGARGLSQQDRSHGQVDRGGPAREPVHDGDDGVGAPGYQEPHTHQPRHLLKWDTWNVSIKSNSALF